MQKNFWDQRYGEKAYAYGEKPNAFFKEQLLKLSPGRILLPAEGEGRNAIFAARHGWEVVAFDQSYAGREKALRLADKFGVTIEYLVGEFQTLSFARESFDAIGLIYAHFSAEAKSEYHGVLSSYLQPGGLIILEAFSKSHLQYSSQNPAAGGPRNIDMLYSEEELRADFANYEMLQLKEEVIKLEEGLYHNGESAVMRMLAKKKHAF
ncbi:class I SAM-dependent methyltransferase [Lewinella cohaerens]|uniref:class I SAM-dependent methyltransferase n=1 Tax=Lewinella cohaerens TaxID=70995 RepID=UPI0003640416|nr:class I SAM-dependent methyltransferase [Lewinella cohaerens]